MAPVMSAPRHRADHERGSFLPSHFLYDHKWFTLHDRSTTCLGRAESSCIRSHRSGGLIFLTLEKSRRRSLIFLENRLSLFALKLECTNVISIECNLKNTGSWRLSSSSLHDPFPRFLGRRATSDPGVKFLVRAQIGFVCTLPVEFPRVQSRGSTE